jgi:outer membrane murein-binding lipoprotein Lpp
LNRKLSGFIISGMSEEHTQNLPDTRSFEERVFARFDAVDAGLRDLNGRVERLEAESERRAVDTKPIWERALAEIVAVSQKVDGLERKVDALQEEVAVISRKVDAIEHHLEVIAIDMLGLRGKQRGLEARMDKLDSEHAR